MKEGDYVRVDELWSSAKKNGAQLLSAPSYARCTSSAAAGESNPHYFLQWLVLNKNERWSSTDYIGNVVDSYDSWEVISEDDDGLVVALAKQALLGEEWADD